MNPRRVVSAVILGLISALFILKYSLRAEGTGWAVAGAYLAVWFALVLWFLPQLFETQRLWDRRNLIGVLVLMCLGALVLMFIWPETNRVGRLPAFRDWIANLFAGRFPYDDPVLTSGFPVIYLLAVPAYFAGNIGLIEAAALALFALAVVRLNGEDLPSAWLQTAALLLLPSVYYELLVRSDLFLNMMLVIVLLLLTDARLARGGGGSRLIWIAVLFGLVLSTRTIVALPYAVYLPYRFREQIGPGILLCAAAALVFALTLLPFYLWDPALFILKGPFGAQLRHLPFWIVLLCLAGGAVLGWRAKDLGSVLFTSGVLLFALTAAAFCLAIADEGFRAILTIDRFDISYFVFCTPFLVLSVRRDKATEKAKARAEGKAIENRGSRIEN